MAFALNQSNLVDLGPLSIVDYPFTLVGWFRVPNVPSLLTLLKVENTAAGSLHSIYYAGNATGWAGAISIVGSVAFAQSTATMATSQWQHVAGVFAADDLRHVYLNGGNNGISVTTSTFNGVDKSTIGNDSTADVIDAAEVAVFDAALSADEIATLATGVSPLSLASAHSLLTYKDLVRRIDHPPLAPVATAFGSPSVVDHPRMMMANGGRVNITMPYRLRGPWQLNESLFRTRVARRSQLSVAGCVSDPTDLHGEVLT